MTERQENGMIAIAVGLLFILIVLLSLSSCGVKKKVIKEYEYVHDTLFISHTDTFMVERWNTRHDTVQMITERIVTLLQADKTLPAETVRVESNNWHYEREVVRDSSSTLVSRIDSILKAMDRQHEKEKTVTKREPPWNLLIFVVAVLAACIIVLKDKK